MDIDMDTSPPEPTDADARAAPCVAEDRVDGIREALLAAARAVNDDLRERELRRLVRRRDAAREAALASSPIDRQ